MKKETDKIYQEMRGKGREEIRQRITEGRSPHKVAELIIVNAKRYPGDWRLAARTQLAAVYQISEANAMAIVSEMSLTN